MVSPLATKKLYQHCDLKQFSFKTTADLEPLNAVVGQKRATQAISFGASIRKEGYNLFAMGSSGTGKHAIVRQFLEQKSVKEPTPCDWCYVNNFAHPHKPIALKLPPGQGKILASDMEQLIEELCTAIPTAFESEDYRTRSLAIEEELKEKQEKILDDIRKKAEKNQVALLRTPVGMAFAPAQGDKVMTPEQFQKLPKKKREKIEEVLLSLQKELQDTLHEIPKWEKQYRKKKKELKKEVSRFAVAHLIDELRKKYCDFPQVQEFFQAVEEDIVQNVQDFVKPKESPQEQLLMNLKASHLNDNKPFRRYMVNALVSCENTTGAPVIYEDHPAYHNLIGRIEHVSQMGTLVTDFSLIKPGALHCANGGYLILDARKVLTQPYAWEALKRVLFAKKIQIESLGQMLGYSSTISLEPAAIPLNIKVIFIGERFLYYLLSHYDPDFNQLFKVVADFSEEIERSEENNQLYAHLIATLVQKEKLCPVNCKGVARIIEYCARIANDSEKLSTKIQSMASLLREADFIAQQEKRKIIDQKDIEAAIDAQFYRSNRIYERMQEEMQRGTFLVDTQGEQIGQVNALSVIQLGQFAFGRPTRITARVRLGKGQVIDIEREVALGGPIHSKGVLILSGYLGAHYIPDKPLSLSASLVFEQSYGGIDGDSASLAELCVLLSAIAEVPIKQCFAMTGSVNQYGQVQAIGGVNEKIEGFFDICKYRGLTGKQAVLIPWSNVKHLMLRHDVIEAVKAKKFAIYAVKTVDEALEVLTGVTAGARNKKGKFPKNTINAKVEAQLIALSQKRQEYAGTVQAKEKG